jgi:hypothetical protein
MERSKKRKLEQLPIVDGTVPTSELWFKFSVSSAVNWPILEGSAPVSLLL